LIYITDVIIQKYSQSFEEIRYNNTIILALTSLFPTIISIGFLFNSDTDIKKAGVIIIVILASILAIKQLTSLIWSNIRLKMFQIKFEMVLLEPEINDEKHAKVFSAAQDVLKDSNTVMRSESIYKSRYFILVPFISALFLVLELSYIIISYTSIELSAYALVSEAIIISALVYWFYIKEFFYRVKQIEKVIEELMASLEKKEAILGIMKNLNYVRNQKEYWTGVIEEQTENMRQIIDDYLRIIDEGLTSYKENPSTEDKGLLLKVFHDVNDLRADMTFKQKSRLRMLDNRYKELIK
jgi:hypothetical protein